MGKFNKECVDAALEKMSQFKREDVEDYLNDVLSKAKKYKNLPRQVAISKASKEAEKSFMKNLFDKSMITARSAEKLNLIVEKFESNKANLRNVIVRDDSGKSQAFSVQASQHASRQKLFNIFHDGMSKEETEFAMDPRNDMDKARAIDGKQDASPMAKKVADRHHALIDATNSEMVLSDAMRVSDLSEDRQVNTTHDKSNMIRAGRSVINSVSNFIKRGEKFTTEGAKELWSSKIKKNLDLDKTFERTKGVNADGSVNHEEVDKIISRNFDNVLNDYSFAKNDFEKERRMKLFYHWKDTESWMDYNQTYGKGDYYNAVLSHIYSSSNKIGSAEILGHNPISMFENLREKQIDIDRELKREPKSNLWYKQTEYGLHAVMGIGKTEGSAKLADFMANLRTLTTMARTTTIALLSQTDAASSASFALRHGASYYSSYREHISHLMNMFPTEERKYMASQFSVQLQSQMGYMGRFIDATNTSNMINKAASAFYKLNGAHLHDKAMKVSAMTVLGKQLANFSHKEMEVLPPKLKQYMESFDITPKEWSILRKKNKENIFALDNVDSLTDKELKNLYADESNKRKSLHDLRTNLYRKVYAMFDVASEHSITNASVFTHAVMTGGTSPGTPIGALTRALTQFKGYPYQFLKRVWVQGLKNADTPQAKFHFAASLLLGTIPISVAITDMLALADGKSPPNPLNMSLPDQIKYGLELVGGNFGVFLKIMDNQNQNSQLALNVLASPSTMFLGNAFSSIFQASGYVGTGGDKRQLLKAKKSAAKAASYILPSSHIPFISPLARAALGQKSYLQPGQKQLYGK